MIKISKEANKNYLCKIVALKNLRKHNNADRLQIVSIDFQNVITGLNAKEGDIYVYFPVEAKINKDFLSYTNSFKDKELNEDKEKNGFFEDNCRVKAVRLRGEKSMGYIVPINEVEAFNGLTQGVLHKYINQEFDVINDVKLIEKYIVRIKQERKFQKSKTVQLSKIIDGQINLHVDTENLRKNVDKLNPKDIISITYKTHGTSWWLSNVLTKKKLNWFEKLLLKIGINIQTSEYSHVYGSRKVVKNKSFDDPKNKNNFYEYDLWKNIADTIGEIPKGMTLYGECLGYTKTGGFIQEHYDYKCPLGEFKLEVYRITQTNFDGLVTELTYPEIVQVCEKLNLTPSHLFYYGKANDLYDLGFENKYSENDVESWRNDFLKELEQLYNEKDCFMCNNKVPEEGIVLRKESLFNCESYKLKSFRFLEYETKQLDNNTINIEEIN